ncbi:MAG TPA: hypothetical protein VH092_21010 [Urbifossiella sp.]|jgi:hypothetical protein|nr:hypothetical protein [Urbifossiella sp.]
MEHPAPPDPDVANRVWQHGMHEERLFHDRLNYFSFLETGLLSICAIMYNKEPAVGFFLPLTVVGLLFTLLWLLIQTRHWAYCEHVHARTREMVPDYRVTLATWAGPGQQAGWSISRPLALAVPILFACTWVAFMAWILIRAEAPGTVANVTPERAAILVLAVVLGWVVLRLRRAERRVKELRRRVEG